MGKIFLGLCDLEIREDNTIIVPERFAEKLEGTELVALALDDRVMIWDRNDVKDLDLERIVSLYSEL